MAVQVTLSLHKQVKCSLPFMPGTVQRGKHQAPGKTSRNTHHRITSIFYRAPKHLVFA